MYPVNNQPLIQWTFDQAKMSNKLDYIFVSTNDLNIIELAKKMNIKTIDRPDHLCDDQATSESALLHALEVIKDNDLIFPDIIIFLQVTSPLRLHYDIDNAINTFIENDADSLFSATRVSDLTIWEKENEIFRSINFDYQNRLRRQDMNPTFIENGSIYIFKPDILKKYNNRLGGKITTYEMEFWQTWEIDSIHEIELIEYFIKKYKIDAYDIN